jgi:uncharacterized membrane protein
MVQARRTLGAGKRRRSQASLVRTLLPVGLALAGAMIYAMNPTIAFLLYTGVISFAVNVLLSALFIIRQKGGMVASSHPFDALVLTMIVPYATMYLLFAFTLTRFRLPIEA